MKFSDEWVRDHLSASEKRLLLQLLCLSSGTSSVSEAFKSINEQFEFHLDRSIPDRDTYVPSRKIRLRILRQLWRDAIHLDRTLDTLGGGWSRRVDEAFVYAYNERFVSWGEGIAKQRRVQGAKKYDHRSAEFLVKWFHQGQGVGGMLHVLRVALRLVGEEVLAERPSKGGRPAERARAKLIRGIAKCFDDHERWSREEGIKPKVVRQYRRQFVRQCLLIAREKHIGKIYVPTIAKLERLIPPVRGKSRKPGLRKTKL
jgi:hypothetical protein